MRTNLAVLLLALSVVGCGGAIEGEPSDPPPLAVAVSDAGPDSTPDAAPAVDAGADAARDAAPDTVDDGTCRCVFRAHPPAGDFICYTQGGTACEHVGCEPVLPVCESSGCKMVPL